MLSELEQLRLILNQMDEYAIFMLDERRIVVRAYEGVARVLGYSPQELVGMSADIIFTGEDRQLGQPEAEAERAHRQGKAVDERWHVKKDGSMFWGSGFMFTLQGRDGSHLGFVKIVRDITERKQLEDHVRALNGELEQRVAERTQELSETTRRLEDFCLAVAHDLRAPLRHISAFAQIVAEDEGERLSSQSRELLQKLVERTKYLDDLIQLLLHYSRISQLEVITQRVELSDVVHHVLDDLKSEIRGKSAQITIQEPMPAVRGEAVVLGHVLTNLITNSLKFVAPGTVPIIRIWAEIKDAWVRLWVEDNGIGILPEHQERIFKMFERLHDTKTFAGEGVGLAIVKRSVERMLGRVGVESEPHQGSKFWIELPGAD